ncbi:MAG: 3-hydroxyacyl-CoA dehydrogenase NAD-binding domain-containing protein [Cyanobacteria bacterium P01_H01_bin.74]
MASSPPLDSSHSSQIVPSQTATIQTVAVIGAGSMGSGIAAQCANAGCQVFLLDIVPNTLDEGQSRNCLAENAIKRMLKASPATDPLNAGFMHPDNAKRITVGNLEDDLERAVANADWVVEVIIENLAIKRQLFERLEPLVKPDAILSSNTSTMPLKDLTLGRSEAFQKQFVITHFFNPPRFMHLLEIISGPKTLPAVTQTIYQFGDIHLGKNVIECKDTPAFLANRIGIYYMVRAITESIDFQMNIEDVDAVLGTPIGFPKEGIFGLLDLVGIGIIPLVTDSLTQILPETDPFRKLNQEKGLMLVNALLRDGRTGRNAEKGGFYRRQIDPNRPDKNAKPVKQAVSLFNPSNYYTLPSKQDAKKNTPQIIKDAKTKGPRAVFESDTKLSQFAWVVVRDTLLYAAHLIPEIAEDIADVDAALRGGYNAKWGPFEIIDRVGIDWFCNRVKADGIALPKILELADGQPFYKEIKGQLHRLSFNIATSSATYTPLNDKPGVLRLSAVKRAATKPLVSHGSASLWDIGDGVTCLEFHSKMNTLDPSILYVINESIKLINTSEQYHAMVIYNEGKQFSLGANLGLIDAGLKFAKLPTLKNLSLSSPLKKQLYETVERLIYQGQSVFTALNYATFPVVGAPQGMALGGGCEILLHCHAVQAGAETYMGLVESGVGLIPGWGGCLKTLSRFEPNATIQGPFPYTRSAFEALLMPQNAVSTSAQDAMHPQKSWLRKETDGITMNPDRVLADAKAKALALLAENNNRPEPPPDSEYMINQKSHRLAGPAGQSALNMAVDDFYVRQLATHHDVVVAAALATAITGGDSAGVSMPVSEQTLLRLEREQFLSLIQTTQTQRRIAHTLKTGKPLREEPAEIQTTTDKLRESLSSVDSSHLKISGRPLTGNGLFELKLMADATVLLLRMSGNT